MFTTDELVCIKEEIEMELEKMYDTLPRDLYGNDEENPEDRWYKDVKMYKSIINKSSQLEASI